MEPKHMVTRHCNGLTEKLGMFCCYLIFHWEKAPCLTLVMTYDDGKAEINRRLGPGQIDDVVLAYGIWERLQTLITWRFSTWQRIMDQVLAYELPTNRPSTRMVAWTGSKLVHHIDGTPASEESPPISSFKTAMLYCMNLVDRCNFHDTTKYHNDFIFDIIGCLQQIAGSKPLDG